MDKINLKSTGEKNSVRNRRSKIVFKKLLPFLLVTGMVLLLAFFIAGSSGSKSFSFIFQKSLGLRSANDHINVLILGIGGGNHDGANLTDTVMVASYDLKTNKVNLISLPRDFWLPGINEKINAAYEVGLARSNGLGFAKETIGNVLGIPIQYAVRLDFNGFEKAIDSIGGVEINVDKSFDDYNYPLEGRENDLCGYSEKEVDVSSDDAKKWNIQPGKRKLLFAPDGLVATDSADPEKGALYFSCRFEHLHFDAGVQYMDGETSLKYVRSRKGTNNEGTDFARSKRQGKVIEAARQKVLSMQTWSDPGKVVGLIQALGQSLDTDISLTEIPSFYTLSKKVTSSPSFVIDDSDKVGLLIQGDSQNYGGAYVLVPRLGDRNYDNIRKFVTQILSGEVNSNEASASARSK